MSRIDQHLQHSIMGMLGSFWSRVATEQAKNEARVIATLAANASDLRWLGVPIQKLGLKKKAIVERVRVPFLDGDFVFIGADLTRMWRSELGLEDGNLLQVIRRDLSNTSPRGQLITGFNGRPLGQNLGHLLAIAESVDGSTGHEAMFVLPLPVGLTPITIATKDPSRVLVHGIDFEVGSGFLLMRESPGDMFPAGGFTVLAGVIDVGAPYNFLTQVNGPTHGQAFISSYCKGSLSRASFERAAAQACGMLVLEQDDTVAGVYNLSGGVTRYVFLHQGVVDLDYPHVELELGKTYSRGHIVSNGFRVVPSGTAGWLRRAVGSRTLSVEGVYSVPDLYLPPSPVIAYFAETGQADKPHARLHLQGSPANLNAFWDLQRGHERRTGLYLSDHIGMTAATPRVTVDLHAMIETFYGSRLLLVLPELDGAPEGYRKRLMEFVRREKPVGATVLVADEPVGLDPAGTYETSEPLDGVYFYGPGSADVTGALEYDNALLDYGGSILVYEGP